jgi:hypothetical protein
VRIITLRPVFLVYYDLLDLDPFYPSFYMLRGRVYKEEPSQILFYPTETLSLLVYFIRFMY